MATKNNAKSLVSNLGIKKIQNTQDTQDSNNYYETTEKRPTTETGCKEGDARTTIILNKLLIKKVKYIALAEGSSIKDKVTEGLNHVIDQWETENGIIPIK